MKKIVLSIGFITLASYSFAQENRPFKGYYENEEYKVYLKFNFYDNNLTVPGQEIFGKLPGFLGDKLDGRKWLISDAKIINNKEADVSMINDVGSEDLKAKIQLLNDSTLRLKQVEGSVLKIARSGKWVRIPKILEFRPHK